MLSKKTLLICLLLLTSVLSAKESTIFHQDSLNYLQKGAMAIQFGISDNFNLSTFAGSSFSFKYHFSSKIALRAIGDLSAQVYDETNQDRVNYSIGGKLAVVYYPKPFYNAAPYFGLGPLILHGYSYQKSKNTSNVIRETEKETYRWSLGISGIMGAELFVRRNISIHAEYFALLYYQYIKNSENITYDDPDYSDTKQNEKYNGYYFNGSNVYFGLSVYF